MARANRVIPKLEILNERSSFFVVFGSENDIIWFFFWFSGSEISGYIKALFWLDSVHCSDFLSMFRYLTHCEIAINDRDLESYERTKYKKKDWYGGFFDQKW